MISNQIITGYSVNGSEYKCNAKGMIIRQDNRIRQGKRNLKGTDEKEVERQLNDLIRIRGFRAEKTMTYQWLSQVLHINKISLTTSQSIVRFIAYVIQKNVPREVYRKLKPIYYWMEENIQPICDFFQENNVQVIFNSQTIDIKADFLVECIRQKSSLMPDPIPDEHSLIPLEETSIPYEDNQTTDFTGELQDMPFFTRFQDDIYLSDS